MVVLATCVDRMFVMLGGCPCWVFGLVPVAIIVVNYFLDLVMSPWSIFDRWFLILVKSRFYEIAVVGGARWFCVWFCVREPKLEGIQGWGMVCELLCVGVVGREASIFFVFFMCNFEVFELGMVVLVTCVERMFVMLGGRPSWVFGLVSVAIIVVNYFLDLVMSPRSVFNNTQGNLWRKPIH